MITSEFGDLCICLELYLRPWDSQLHCLSSLIWLAIKAQVIHGAWQVHRREILKDMRMWFHFSCFVSGPGSRSSSTSSLSSIASGAPPTPTSPRRRLATEPLDSAAKTPLRDQQQANNQVNNSSTNGSSTISNKLQPLRKNTLPGEIPAALVLPVSSRRGWQSGLNRYIMLRLWLEIPFSLFLNIGFLSYSPLM